MTTYYKVLGNDGRPFHGGKGTWPLPANGSPGKWKSVTGVLQPCAVGLHLCRETDLISWLGPTIYLAEVPPDVEMIDHGDKVVVRKARLVRRFETWNEKTARLFAADCAEDALPLFGKLYPNDHRVRDCIEAVRAYARGEATDDQRDAASDAARAASAASYAARAASYAASAASDAARAASCAARAASAASDAASAASDAASAASARYTGWLMEYLRGERPLKEGK